MEKKTVKNNLSFGLEIKRFVYNNILLNWEIKFARKFFTSNYYKKLKTLLQRYDNSYRGIKKGLITQEEIDMIIDEQASVTDSKAAIDKMLSYRITKENLNDTEHLYHYGTRTCLRLFNHFENEINSLANIGARFDLAFDYLSKQYSNKTFYSIDFMKDMALLNEPLEPTSNWQFLSGYGYDFLKEENFNPDVVFFNGTTVLMRRKELNEFMRIMAKKVKFIVLSESCFPNKKSLNFFDAYNFESLDQNYTSIVGYAALYQHNYIHILESFGFEVEYAEIFPFTPRQHISSYDTIQIIAKNTNI
jgi:hypothetical protein